MGIYLPEVNAFTIDEIADRWNCDRTKVISYFGLGMLRIQYQFNGQAASHNMSEKMNDEPHFCLRLTGFFSIDNHVVNFVLAGGRNAFVCVAIDGKGSRYLLESSFYLDSCDLKITKEERDKFEMIYKDIKNAGLNVSKGKYEFTNRNRSKGGLIRHAESNTYKELCRECFNEEGHMFTVDKMATKFVSDGDGIVVFRTAQKWIQGWKKEAKEKRAEESQKLFKSLK
ncbi:MAG TPA: hypothetical protein EYQ65_00265 [Cycloclasticus sp.]|nr:hypothetical protein [Cycloclasticus sp.]